MKAVADRVSALLMHLDLPESRSVKGFLRTDPAPTNLKVLPKESTGQQVHEIREQFQNLKRNCLNSNCRTGSRGSDVMKRR